VTREWVGGMTGEEEGVSGNESRTVGRADGRRKKGLTYRGLSLGKKKKTLESYCS
jgi:hypothetical protein